MPKLQLSSGALSAAAIALRAQTNLLESVSIFAKAGAGAQAMGTVTLSEDLALGEKITVAGADFTCAARYAQVTVDAFAATSGDDFQIGGHAFVAKPKYASGTATLAAVAAGNKLTVAGHDFTARAKYAVGTITFDGLQAGDSFMINELEFTAVAADATGHEFLLGANDDAAATNAAGAIMGAAMGVSASANGAVVTVTATTGGAVGNLIELSTEDATIDLSGATLAGAYDSSLDEFPIEANDDDTATALADAINASTSEAIAGVVAATVATNVVTVTAVEEGVAGNAITFTKTGAPITLSPAGGALTPAYDAAQDQWPVGASAEEAAEALAAAINASTAEEVAGVVTASATALVLITPVAEGAAAGAAISYAGGTLAATPQAAAFDATADEWPLMPTLAESALRLAQAINESDAVAIDGVVTATGSTTEGKVYVRAVAVGAAGNTITLTKTGDHIAVSGAVLAGGATANRTMTVKVLDKDDAVLFSQDVTLEPSSSKAVTIHPGASGTAPLGIPLVLGSALEVSVPAASGTTASVTVLGS